MVDCCPYPRCKEEYLAKFESRETYKGWMLNPSIFKKACKILEFSPDLGWFALKLNTQIKIWFL